MLDASGRVIGINSQIYTGGSSGGSIGIGFAVPIDTAKSEIAHVLDGAAARPDVGAGVAVKIDWDLRYARMRMHTALHLLSAVLPYKVTGGAVGESESRLDFVRTQVLTARNVRGHPVTDLWYGSLNYQIEHHLFPGMPRLNMRRAQPIIRQFCQERGIEYYETSFFMSYRELLGFLNEIGAPLRAERARV